MNEIINKIKTAAGELTHDFIILDALKNDIENGDIEEAVYMETIQKIKHIEEKYTAEEIEKNNLLFDIW